MQQENKKTTKIIFNKSTGFTLVELIIVITILAILGTIAYISFQGFTKDARDSSRMSDIKQLYNGISIYKTQTEKTPMPDSYVNILSGTTTISYQGYAGTSVLRLLKITGGKDPGTKDYYIYTTDVNQKKGQLMTFMETADKDVQLLGRLKDLNLIDQAQATNTGYYQDKKIYVFGDKIGILTDSNKVPLQETTTSTGINLLTTTTPLTTYFGGSVYSGGLSTSTGLTLVNQINGVINNINVCSEGYVLILNNCVNILNGNTNINFNNSLNYTYNSSNIEINNGIAKLKDQGGGGVTWTNLTNPGNDWIEVTYGNGIYIAVGSSDAIATSTDGINWTARTASNGGGKFTGVAYGNGLFVVVTDSDNGGTYAVMTSTDGISWIGRTANKVRWLNVDYVNNLFIASGRNGNLMTSPDGINWTTRTASTTDSWITSAYGSGIYVVFGQTNGDTAINYSMSSPDGINWTSRTLPVSANWQGVTYGNGLFVAVGDNKVITSPDGINWTNGTPASGISYLVGITYGNGLFTAIDYYYGSNHGMTSPDGINWTARTINNANLYDITNGNGLFVTVSRNGGIYSSPSNNYLSSNIYSLTTSNDKITVSSNWLDIKPVIINETLNSQNIYYSLSFDNKNTFKVNTNGIWRSIAKNNGGTWQYNSNTTYGSETWINCSVNNQENCLSQAYGVNQNKMTGTQLANINTEKWKSSGGFSPGITNYIDFSVGITTTNTSLTPTLDNISLNYSYY